MGGPPLSCVLVDYKWLDSLWGVRRGVTRVWVSRGDPRVPKPVCTGQRFTRFRMADALDAQSQWLKQHGEVSSG